MPLVVMTLLLVLIGIASITATDESLYQQVSPANTSELLQIVSQLPMRVFELADDSMVGRRHFGVVGDELDALIPEAVVKSPLRTHVDDTLLFMYGVGAVQELASLQSELSTEASDVEKMATESSQRCRLLKSRIEIVADEADSRRVLDERDRRQELVEAEVGLEAEMEAEVESAGHRDRLEREALVEASEKSRDRIRQEDAADAARHAEALRLREESTARQEAAKRETDAALLEQRLENERLLEVQRREAELARVKAEAQAKANAERENEALRIRAMRARMAEDRQRVLEAVALVAHYLGQGAAALLDDPRAFGTVVLVVASLICGAFFSRETAKLARSLAEAYLGRPRLVRETSRKRRIARLFNWFCSAPRRIYKMLSAISFAIAATCSWRLRCLRKKVLRNSAPNPDDHIGKATASSRAAEEKEKILDEQSRFLNGVVLPSSLRDRVLRLAVANRNARKNGAPFRHMLLHGPPGTGKTLVAKRLAKASGLEYALMSGGDVGPLGADGVTALHALFRWARTSDTGVLIFIDEAEAFLASRSRTKLTEHMRNALNAFLYQTGSPTHSFLLVLATNRAQDLDEAVLDRVDETLYFDVPATPERRLLVRLYYEMYVASLANKKMSEFLLSLLSLPAPLSLDKDLRDDDIFESATLATEGFSGREIEKLMVAVQSAAYGAGGGRLDAASFLTVVQHKSTEHACKVALDKETNKDDGADKASSAKNEDERQESQIPSHQYTHDQQFENEREKEIIRKMNAADGFIAELESRLFYEPDGTFSIREA